MGIEEWENCPHCGGAGEYRWTVEASMGTGMQPVPYVAECLFCYHGIVRKC